MGKLCLQTLGLSPHRSLSLQKSFFLPGNSVLNGEERSYKAEKSISFCETE